MKKLKIAIDNRELLCYNICRRLRRLEFNTVGLAQLVSASGCGPEGRGFESHISPQKKTLANASVFFNEICLWQTKFGFAK